MSISHFNREKTGLFTDISNRLSYNQNGLENYINQPFSINAFKQQVDLKSLNFSNEKRNILVDVLTKSYSNISNEIIKKSIDSLLNKNTFTITTGHQLSIFTGPIYFIYKILHTIRLTEELNKIYPENKFIPVFWMASEDHDFEEIQSINLFNKTIKWDSEQKGPVGRFETESFEAIKDEFKELFQNNPESEVLELINSYDGKNLSEATFNLVNKLFGKYGLIIVDGDEVNLKKEFIPILEKELTTQFSFQEVTLTNESLQKENIKLQITPREINLFYIEKNLRSRIQTKGDNFYIEGKGDFSKEEILIKLKEHPECFSPNVVLRPLYQETILPNLCYLGGGGEIAYWLQLKRVFESVNCTYPLIQIRNSIQLIDSNSLKKMEKINISIKQLFVPIEELKKEYVLANSNDELNFEIIDNSFLEFSNSITKQIIQIDSSLINYAEAEISRMEKQLISIKQKMIKTEKNKHEQALNQIEQIKNKLFPNGGLQERNINFFSLCSDGKVYSHLEEIYNAISPFENDLIVIH